MLQTILYIVMFFITLLILVTLHELGHFWVARWLGVKTLCFSFGFGKALWRRTGRDGTQYLFSWLPLGGYVRLLDSREGPIPDADKQRAFDTKPIWVRLAILFAGPAFNWLLGLVAFTLVFLLGIERITPVIGDVLPQSIAAVAQVPTHARIIAVDGETTDSWQKVSIALIKRLGDSGQLTLTLLQPSHANSQTYALPLVNWTINRLEPDPLSSLGIVPYQPLIPPVIAEITKQSPAANVGLQSGDRFIAVDQQPVDDWIAVAKYIQQHPNERVHLQLIRNQQPVAVDVQTDRQWTPFHWVGKIGVRAESAQWPAGMRYTLQLSPILAVKQAVQEVASITNFNFVVLKKMLQGKISLLSLGGPIAIFETSTMAFQQGLAIYIGFIGLISVMLACMNILPIPGLDGGQILFCIIEGVMRRPIALRWQWFFLRLGIILLMLLMVQATVNDVMRLL